MPGAKQRPRRSSIRQSSGPSREGGPIPKEDEFMSSIPSTFTGRRSVSAFFDSKADADEAASRIRAEGVPDSDIRIVAGDSDGNRGDGSAANTEARGEKKGFWESLSDFFLPSEDRYAYAEGLSRGGYFVSVATNDANHARILDILDDEGTVDMDEREASWRSEGWSGYQGGRDDRYQGGRDDLGTEAFGRPASAADGTLGGAASDAGYGARDAAATGATAGTGATSGLERFGRRDTAENRGRVRSYFTDDDATFGSSAATGGDPSVVNQAQPVSDQFRRTDVELEDERRETADDIARRTRGAI
jgi:hypothetical protein